MRPVTNQRMHGPDDNGDRHAPPGSSTPAADPSRPRAADVGSPWQWVVIETLAGSDQATLVLDGQQPRVFSRPARASIARSNTAAHLLGPVVELCVETGQTHDKYLTLPDDRLQRLIGVPVLGPSGSVHAVAVWAGALDQALPRMPIVGALSWNVSGLLTASPAAQFLLESASGDLTGHTITELLAGFDHFDDRENFLALFNLANMGVPADQWVGTATKTYSNGRRRELFLAARALGNGAERVVCAVVVDITDGAANPSRPDLTLAAVRAMPVPLGHAVGLVDLKTAFVHEWLTPPHSALASWRHHNPVFSNDDRMRIAEACIQLVTGARDTVTMRVQVRFDEDADWIPLEAQWTLILGGERPQALLDVAPLAPIPTPVVPGCQYCADITRTFDATKQTPPLAS